MAGEMTNIEIKDFLTVSGVGINDFVVLSLSGGTSAKMAVGVFKTALTASIKPSIREGVWWVGETNLGVTAEGKNPEFRKTSLGIEWKYTTDNNWTLLVPLADIVFDFDDLTPSQKDELRLKFDDLTEENIAELQKPANDMIETLTKTNADVTAAEQLRVNSENERVSAETGRKTAESQRSTNETTRQTNEERRVSNESARATAETNRASAESKRVSNEDERVAAENRRVSAETSRANAESTRVTNENQRKSQEQTRVSNEQTRVTSESKRESNESSRQEKETVRESNEQTRIQNEQGRVDAETLRNEGYEALKKEVEEAASNANNAASEARNPPIIRNDNWWIYNTDTDEYEDSGTSATGKSPKIVNGNWWTWDDEKGEYVDSGQSVSSDYVLTKENVESVLTGDIETHYHSQYAETDDIPTKVSDLENDSEYVTISVLEGKGYVDNETFTQELNGKQETIDDLEAIREGASKGATALQSVPSEYVTEEELSQKGYATQQSVNEGVSAKQDKNVYFANVEASVWLEDTTYTDYPYRCDMACEGVTADMVAEVVFGVVEATSGDYAPVCESGDGKVSIWSNTNSPITVPTIIINK